MKKVVCYLSVIFLFSCAGKNIKNAQANSSSNSFEIIYQNSNSSIPKKSYRVIRNVEDFRAFFISMKEEKIPNIDFSNSNVLLLNMGKKNTGGYSVVPEKIIEDNGKLIMMIKETYPKKGDMVTMAVTNPVCIVKINSKKEILIK